MTVTQLRREPVKHGRALDVDVVRILRELEGGSVDRRSLQLRTSWPDRRVRRAIEECRLRGHLVVTLNKTYKLAANRAEFDEWVRLEQESRLATFHLQLSEMTRRADRLWPLEPRAHVPRPVTRRPSPGQLQIAI